MNDFQQKIKQLTGLESAARDEPDQFGGHGLDITVYTLDLQGAYKGVTQVYAWMMEGEAIVIPHFGEVDSPARAIEYYRNKKFNDGIWQIMTA
jgi:hypothetical protein